YSVEAGKTSNPTNIDVTDFSLEGTTINAAGGSDDWHIRYDDAGTSAPGNRPLAFDGVVQFSPSSEGLPDHHSIDGNGSANSVTDTADAIDNNTLDYIYGAGGNDTLTGGNEEPDILNGGAGADSIDGNSGNDIIVYDPADVAPATPNAGVDGGAGADGLRIDTGALAAFFHDADPTHYLPDLRGAGIHNIEGIGITAAVPAQTPEGPRRKV